VSFRAHNNEFKELIEQARYNQGLVIIIKFHQGLDKEIENIIANIPIGCPADDNAEACYKAAIPADENWTAKDLFHSSPKTSWTLKTVGNVFSWTYPTSWPMHPTTFTPLKAPTPQNPTPMDIDAAKKNTQHAWHLLALWKGQTLDKGLWMPIRHSVYACQGEGIWH
jgi:hypothetical protein